MTVSFDSETWKYVEDRLNKLLNQQKDVLSNYDSTYKDVMRAQGYTAALKTLLELPQTAKLIAATKPRN